MDEAPRVPQPRIRVFSGAPNVAAQTPRVLNTGCGPRGSERLHQMFRAGWTEVRLDIDPNVAPDVVASIDDMRGVIADGSMNAIWASHNLEHLYAHEVPRALQEFRRVLKPEGFALITCPDLEAVAAHLLSLGSDDAAYVSASGPIAPLDMIYGHRASVAAGNHYMAHKTGFTAESLGRLGCAAGFDEVRVAASNGFDLWALLLLPDTDRAALRQSLAGTSESFLLD